MTGDAGPATPPADPTGTAGALDELRAQLEGIAELPVAARPEVFERANQVVAGELAALEEV